MIKEVELIKVKTLSKKLASQVRVPSISDPMYKAMVSDFHNAQIGLNHSGDICGWCPGEAIDDRHRHWFMVLMNYGSIGLFWLLVDKSHTDYVSNIPQLFIG